MKHHCKTVSDYFSDYIKQSENQERHTVQACDAYDRLYAYIDKLLERDSIAELVDEVAIEYERSGFEAGFKMASQMAMAILLAGKAH